MSSDFPSEVMSRASKGHAHWSGNSSKLTAWHCWNHCSSALCGACRKDLEAGRAWALLAGTVPKARFSKPWKSLPLPSTPDTASGFLDSKDWFEGDLGWPSACSLSERKWNIITMQTKLLQEGSQHNVTMKWKGYFKITVQVSFCYTPMSLYPWDDTVARYCQCKTALI